MAATHTIEGAVLAMEDIRQLAAYLNQSRVARARAMPPADKLSAGFRLFEYACSISRAGIQQQFPGADHAEVERILAERLALRKRLEVGRWKSKQ